MIRRHYRTCNDLNKKLLAAADDKPQTVREHVLNHSCHALNETINHKNVMFSFRVSISIFFFLFRAGRDSVKVFQAHAHNDTD